MSKKTMKEAKPKQEVTLSGAQVMNFYNNERNKLSIIQRRFDSLQNLLNETMLSINSLNELKKSSKNEKILVNLGAGVFADALIENNGKVKVSLAGNVVLDKPVDEALLDLEKRKNELEKDINVTINEQEATLKQISALENVINTARKAVREKRSKLA